MADGVAHDPGRAALLFLLAIVTALPLRAAFRLALRQTERLVGSVIHLLGLTVAVPDHTTSCRRAETLEAPRPQPHRDSEPVHRWWTARA